MSRSIHVMGSTGYSPASFVSSMLEALAKRGGIVNRPYSLILSMSSWPDVWHFNWPERSYESDNALGCLFRCVKLLGQMRVARHRGTRIAWTVHNLMPHEIKHPRIEDWFWRRFRRRVDLFVHLSEAGGNVFRERYPNTRDRQHTHLRHPAYAIPKSDWIDRDQARLALSIPPFSKVFLVSGMLRPYKNVPETISAFRGVEDSDAVLYIAGHAITKDLEKEITSAAGGDPRVRVRFGFLENSELRTLIRASDAVLLSQEHFLNSGLLLHALSLSRPVFSPLTPVTAEVAYEVGPGWILTYANDLDTSVFRTGLNAIESRDPTLEGPDLSLYDWDDFASGLINAYSRAIGAAEDVGS